MTPSLKSLAVPFIGCVITGWLCSPDAHAAIAEAVANPPQDIADLVQKWGVTLAIIGTVVGAIAAKAISTYWGFRRQWQQQQDAFDDDRKKRREIVATQEIHDVQIKQVNAALGSPVPTIPPPTNSQPPTP